MKNILVTGGAGFIGSNFIQYLISKVSSIFVVNLDRLAYSGHLENLKKLELNSQHLFIKGDICNPKLVIDILTTHSIDTIINFAAETHVDRAIIDSRRFVRTNVMGVHNLLECARKRLEKVDIRFHQVSTDKVFGSLLPNEPPFSELSPYRPICPYGASKAAADHIAMAYWKTHGLPVTISYSTNNYGPFQYPEKLIPLVIFNALRRENIHVYGDGLQICDWLHVEDSCDALLRILSNAHSGECYNMAGNAEASAIEVVEIVCALLDERLGGSFNHGSLIQHIRNRPGQSRRLSLCTTKIKLDLGWTPRFNLQKGLSATIDWYLNNLDWLNNISSQASFRAWLRKNYPYSC